MNINNKIKEYVQMTMLISFMDYNLVGRSMDI